MRSLPIFRACASTCRYRESRAATPTPTRLSPGRAPSTELCNIEALCPKVHGAERRTGRLSPWRAASPKRASAQRLFVHAVDRDLLSVHLDHRQVLPVATLELAVARDVDLLELESELVAQPFELDAREL